jgi:hypothetical protein
MRYIHFSCLQSWLKTRSTNLKQYHSTTVSAYFIKKNFDCELCKKTIPDIIKQKNQVFNILDFLKSDYKNYIILESYLSTTDRRNYPTARQFYTLKLDDKTNFKIGRGHESDLRLNDISISRIHAQFNIKYDTLREKPYITVSDCDSKFGTLSYCFNPRILIIKPLPLCIQIGRSLLNFRVVKPYQLFRCILNCFLCKNTKVISKKKFNDYQDQNAYALEKINQKHLRRIKSISFNDETEDEQSRIKNMANTELNSNVNAININVNYNSQNFNSNALLINDLKNKDLNDKGEIMNLDDLNEYDVRYNKTCNSQIVQVYAKPSIVKSNNIDNNYLEDQNVLINQNILDNYNENNEENKHENYNKETIKEISKDKENKNILEETINKKGDNLKFKKKTHSFSMNNNRKVSYKEIFNLEELTCSINKVNLSFSHKDKNRLEKLNINNNYFINTPVKSFQKRNVAKVRLTKKINPTKVQQLPNIIDLIHEKSAFKGDLNNISVEDLDLNNKNKVENNKLMLEVKYSHHKPVDRNEIKMKNNQTKKIGSQSQQKVTSSGKGKGKSSKTKKSKLKEQPTNYNNKEVGNLMTNKYRSDLVEEEYITYYPQKNSYKSNSKPKSSKDKKKSDYNLANNTDKRNEDKNVIIENNLININESALMKDLKSDNELNCLEIKTYNETDNNINYSKIKSRIDSDYLENQIKFKKSNTNIEEVKKDVKVKKRNVESDQTLPLNTSKVKEINFNEKKSV